MRNTDTTASQQEVNCRFCSGVQPLGCSSCYEVHQPRQNRVTLDKKRIIHLPVGGLPNICGAQQRHGPRTAGHSGGGALGVRVGVEDPPGGCVCTWSWTLR